MRSGFGSGLGSGFGGHLRGRALELMVRGDGVGVLLLLVGVRLLLVEYHPRRLRVLGHLVGDRWLGVGGLGWVVRGRWFRVRWLEVGG